MIQKTKFLSYCTGKLTEGCKFCVEGRKLVLFITGKCRRGCFYCPLSEKRKEKDIVWANERKLSNVNAVSEAIEEARLSQAKGAGITGGDPLLILSRTLKFTKALKKKFGKNFHIHIYLPTLRVSKQKLMSLYTAGIDEVRFHPDFLKGNLKKEIAKIKLAKDIVAKKKRKWLVGIEIPVIPKTEKKTIALIDSAKGIIDFLNLNELEISTTNAFCLYKFGLNFKKNSCVVQGSNELALKILKYCDKNAKNLRVHYCTASTKDRFQYCNRLKLRLMKVKKPYDEITQDNDLYRAALYSEIIPGFDYEKRISEIPRARKIKILEKMQDTRNILMKRYDIPSKLIEIDEKKLRILTSAEIATKLAKEIKNLGLKPAIIIELPTYDNLQIQLNWL